MAKIRVSYLSVAEKRYRNAAWIEGHGRFAVLAHCKVLTVTLWNTRQEAQDAKRFIDDIGCGGVCKGKHEIVDLTVTPTTNRKRNKIS